MNIIKHSEFCEVTSHVREFSRDPDRLTSGYGFDCDEDGKLLNEAQRERYEWCLQNPEGDLYDRGIISWTNHYREPAIGKCGCGREVELANFTNTCDCGVDYNSAGQQLADRSQWGEETGEHWSECY